MQFRRWLFRGGAKGTAALGATVVLVAGGGSAIGWAASHQFDAPQPSPAAAGSLVPSPPAGAVPGPGRGANPSATPKRTTSPAVGPLLPRSRPTDIAIPAIAVRSRLQDLGLNPDGTLAVPQPGPHYNEAAWYTGSPTPGALGPAVIEGHIDSAAEGPSVFFRLGALTPGDRVYVGEADGKVAVFSVNAVRSYPKTAFPTLTVYANTNYAALRLLTCGGRFDHTTHSYLSNTVVYAHLIASQPPGAPEPAR